MKRKDEFECRLDALLKEFSDLEYSEIADVLDYYACDYQRKADRE